MSFVLIERVASKRRGQPLWFKAMTSIGPMTTASRVERAEFPSREEAMRSAAYSHPLSFFEVEEA